MSKDLLKEIAAAAVDGSAPVAGVLRKCAVLGTRLKNDDLRDWALKELNGYENLAELPDYRKVAAVLTGHLAGPFGSGFKNVAIPTIGLPDSLKARAEEMVFGEGVASLEASLEGSGDSLVFNWPGNWIALLQRHAKLADELQIYGAWQSTSKATVAGILDTIRNRVLEFCLRLEGETPTVMVDDDQQVTPATETAASQVFNQVFVFGSKTGNIANASPSAEQTIGAGDIQGLMRVLTDAGVPDGEIAALRTAIDADGQEGQEKLGPKGASWYKRAKQAVGAGAWSLTQGATITTIRQAILSYYGLSGE